ncbi:MAG TPA: hypothetical protein PL151_18425 [Phycisphaerae bacterium]|nr:hypothetical protein [Phycisphaerae bacterium]HQA00678.1 hypothetical protein [Phycisphaerae bacterium]HQE29733.1 hypothetical protein [Phycisphaerae bacterium]
MPRSWLTYALVLLSTAPGLPQAAPTPAFRDETRYAEAGPHEVATLRLAWTDDAREREVPVKIYYPANEEGPFPIVIFSHGLGGSREGYAFLGRHWASHGYVSVHLEHEGSDAEVWRGQTDAARELQRAAKDPRNAINRPKDVSFAIDQLQQLQAEDGGPLGNALALDRIAVAGHSFGAFTALAVVGELGTYASEQRLADPRVKCAILMSTPVPVSRRDRYDAVYGEIVVPCLHMTGTLDETPIAVTKVEDRRIPYDHIQRAEQYLVTFVGGDHAIFSGRPRRGSRAEKDPLFHKLILAGTTAFLEAYLADGDEAKTWLRDGGYRKMLATNARFEHKRPEQPADAFSPQAGRTSTQPVRSSLGSSTRQPAQTPSRQYRR